MSKKILQVKGAPAAVGPYNHVVQANGLTFFSGQIPLDPKTGELVSGGIEAQTLQVFKNIGALLDSIGKSFQDVVKTTIFLTDLTHFATLNKLYQEAFQTDFPTRSTVQVAALPKGALIEIELIVA